MSKLLQTIMFFVFFTACASQENANLAEPVMGSDEVSAKGFMEKDMAEADVADIDQEMQDAPETTEDVLEQESGEETIAADEGVKDSASPDESLDTLAGLQAEASTREADDETTPAAPPKTSYISQDAERGRYVIQPGDTLALISKRVMGSAEKWQELADMNQIKNPNLIFPGDVLHFPMTSQAEAFLEKSDQKPKKSIKVKAGDSLYKIAQELFGSADYWKPIWQLNADQIANPDHLRVGQTIYYYAQNVAEESAGQKRRRTAH